MTPPAGFKLSVIVPVYNERRTLPEILKKVQAAPFSKEIVIVDDCSSDGTREILAGIKDPNVVVLLHDRNRGKGAAIRTGLEKATGDAVLIQDADLEYDPADYPALLEPILNGQADVVYGSRFLGGPHRVLFFWHYLGNLFFTLVADILYNINLTDMGTGYKVFRRDALKSMRLESSRFGFEAEVTAKVCKSGLRLYETPISYSGRTYDEGKKIRWVDGLSYLYALLKYRFFD